MSSVVWRLDPPIIQDGASDFDVFMKEDTMNLFRNGGRFFQVVKRKPTAEITECPKN